MIKKVFEIEIDGVQRGFRFNMLSIGKACRLENCDVSELISRVVGEVKDDVVVRAPDLQAMVNFFFAGAVNYCEGKGIKVDFTAQDVCDWLEHIGLEKTKELLYENLKVSSKNMEAPIEAGQ